MKAMNITQEVKRGMLDVWSCKGAVVSVHANNNDLHLCAAQWASREGSSKEQGILPFDYLCMMIR